MRRELVHVPFSGNGAGRSELSWGQAGHLAAMLRMGTWHPLGGIKPLPAGTTLADVAAELGYLVSRYQTMRTRMRFPAGRRPEQVVTAAGEIDLEVVDTHGGDPDRVAAEVRARYEETGMDFAAEWPVRMAVVRHLGVLTHMVVLISHIATDAYGGAVMLEETAARTDAPVDGLQPLAQAEWQLSPAGRRHHEAAMRYYDRILREIPARRFPVRPAPAGDDPAGRYRQGELRSAAIGPAVAAIAARTGHEQSRVLLAAYAVALHRVTGASPVVVRPLVSNRFRPGLRRVVCTLVQAGICVLDPTGAPFDEVLDRAQRAAMPADKYAYYDPYDLDALIERVGAERGEEVRLDCYINDRRGVRPAEPGTRPAELRELAAGTSFGWSVARDEPAFESLFLHIDDVDGAVELTVQLDTHEVAAGDGEALVRGIEAVLVAAAEHRPASSDSAAGDPVDGEVGGYRVGGGPGAVEADLGVAAGGD